MLEVLTVPNVFKYQFTEDADFYILFRSDDDLSDEMREEEQRVRQKIIDRERRAERRLRQASLSCAVNKNDVKEVQPWYKRWFGY